MKLSMLSLAAVIGFTVTSPVTFEARADHGSYTVSGSGRRKQVVLSAGGNILDMVISMLDTENMDNNYVHGDGNIQDLANFGVLN